MADVLLTVCNKAGEVLVWTGGHYVETIKASWLHGGKLKTTSYAAKTQNKNLDYEPWSHRSCFIQHFSVYECVCGYDLSNFGDTFQTKDQLIVNN